MELTANSLSFLSFNIKGLKPRNYDYLVDLYNKYDILLIQETWLYKFEENKVLELLNGSRCFSTSAMNDNEIGRLGRPYGGCMIIWKHSINVPIFQLNTLNDRVCAITLVSNTTNMLVLSVYMPNDDGSNESFNEFSDVLIEVLRLMTECPDYKVIIGGDFNVDLTTDTRSRNKDLLCDFIYNNSLISCNNENDSFSYTYESSLGKKTVLDYFLVSENGIGDIKDFSVLYDGCNLSDHFPVLINFSNDKSIEYLLEDDDDCQCNNDWKNASTEDLTS